MTTPTTRRAGLSMTEVLVALFIMAIGVMGVLTLFPVGAVQMGNALKDQRCAEAAISADGYIRWYWKHFIVETDGKYKDSGTPPTFTEEPLWTALNGATTAPSTVPVNANPSPPVVVDPMGYVARTAPNKDFLSSPVSSKRIARVNLGMINAAGATNQQSFALRTCTLLDGLTYNPDTGHGVASGERDDRYNWLWVIQRPSNANKFTANLTIVVFNKRAHMYAPPVYEQDLPCSNLAGTTTVTVSGPMPAGLQTNSWFIDTSVVGSERVCAFYRVVGVNGQDIELQTPSKQAINSGTFWPAVAEVFERSPLTDGTSP